MTSMDQAIAAAPAQPTATEGEGYRRWAVFLLASVSLFNIMDRQIVNILAELIRQDLGLTDGQLGLLTGLAFALFYAGLSLPLARLAETRNRSWIIAGALALWSGFTALGGVAQTFTQLFLTRVFVGVGEAASGPASQSLAADLVPAERRASALATAAVGIPLGTLVGMGLGGWIGGEWGWRAALISAGLPGLVVALVVRLTLRDPRPPVRQGPDRDDVPFAAAMREILSKRSFLWFTMGSALLSITNLAVAAFAGSFFLRVHAASLEQASTWIAGATGAELGPTGVLGVILGLVLGLSGALGVLIGGFVADKARAKDPGAYMSVAAIGGLVSGPLFTAALLAPSGQAAFALLAVPVALSNGAIAPVLASAQSVVRPRVRATAAATLTLGVNLVALGLGPLIVGALSDGFATSLGAAEGLRWALVTSCAACPLGAACFWAARRTFRNDVVS